MNEGPARALLASRAVLWIAPVLSLALAAVPRAAQDPRRIIQPTEYHSAAGRWALHVDPSERHGEGSASYRMELDGQPAWAASLAFTFLDARIAEDGTVAGYAIAGRGCGELWIAIVAADGTVRRLDAVKRTTPGPDSGCEPWIGRVRLSSERFDVELLFEGGGSTWQSYRLSTGATLADAPAREMKEQLSAPSASPPRTAQPVPDLELAPPRRVDFPGFDSDRAPDRHFVDARGCVWISEFRSHVVRSFDADGALRFECVPEPDPVKRFREYDWIAVRPDGGLVGCADDQVIAFDERGALVGATSNAEPFGSFLLYPREGQPWKVRTSNVERSARIERGASDRWFRALTCAAVVADGSLAVVDEPATWAFDGDPTRYLHVFSPDGAPRAMLPLPEACPTDGLAYDGERFVLVGAGELWALRADGSCIGRARLPDALGRAREVFFARAGAELWLFAPAEAAMWVFDARWR